MKQEETKKTYKTQQKGGTKMALYATPCQEAFRIDAKMEQKLHQPNNTVLDALQKIRQAELRTATPSRLQQLDRQILAVKARQSGRRT